MKNVFVLFLLIFVSSYSQKRFDTEFCYDENKSSDDFFRGNHNLLSLNSMYNKSQKEIKEKANGWFFVAIGAYKSEKKETETNKRIATFSWQNDKQEYIFSEVPLEQVRFIIDSTIASPYCKFRWVSTRDFCEHLWWEYVIYVVFVLREENIMGKVELNLN